MKQANRNRHPSHDDGIKVGAATVPTCPSLTMGPGGPGRHVSRSDSESAGPASSCGTRAARRAGCHTPGSATAGGRGGGNRLDLTGSESASGRARAARLFTSPAAPAAAGSESVRQVPVTVTANRFHGYCPSHCLRMTPGLRFVAGRRVLSSAATVPVRPAEGYAP